LIDRPEVPILHRVPHAVQWRTGDRRTGPRAGFQVSVRAPVPSSSGLLVARATKYKPTRISSKKSSRILSREARSSRGEKPRRIAGRVTTLVSSAPGRPVGYNVKTHGVQGDPDEERTRRVDRLPPHLR
jgi:hypothetical protein